MPGVAHETVKALGAIIEVEMKDARWQHDGKEILISRTGEASKRPSVKYNYYDS